MVKKIQKARIKKRTDNKVDKSEKQFFWVVGVVVVMLLIIIFVPLIKTYFFDRFEYGGVQFEKLEQGEITFYHGIFPIIYNGDLISYHNFYFRTDPRKNDIAVNTSFKLSKNVIIGLSPGVEECQSIVLAQPQLATFIKAFPFVTNLSSGINDRNAANSMNLSYVGCENASDGTTVVLIRKSSAPSIDLGSRSNCYIFNVGECEYLETVEKYMMSVAAQINNVTIN